MQKYGRIRDLNEMKLKLKAGKLAKSVGEEDNAATHEKQFIKAKQQGPCSSGENS